MERFYRSLFILITPFLGIITVNAQNYPVYTNFYNNLFLINPAEAGNIRKTEASINYRRQWVGIEGAPVISTFAIHTLIDGTRTAIGGRVSSFTRGLLSTTDITFSYNYSIALSKKLNLNFGMSGGLISNSIDLDQVDNPDDPAIVSFLDNNLQPAGNFGLKLESDGLNFSVALPQLFGQTFINESNFEGFSNITPLDNVVGMIYYRRKAQQQIKSRSRSKGRSKYSSSQQIAPLEAYLVYRYSSFGNSQLEALTKLNLSDAFWIGGSWKQGHGFSGNTGVNAGNLTVSYGFDPSFNQVSGLGNGTHEIQLQLRIGRQKRLRKSEIEIQSRLTGAGNDNHQARYNQSENNEIRAIPEENKDKKKFLIYIKAFRDFSAADDYSQKIRQQEYNANVFYYPKTKKYYVHVFETTKLKKAKQEKKNLLKATKFRNPQILIVELDNE